MAKTTDTRKAAAEYITQPVIRLLVRTPVTPNTITWLGFIITVGAAVLVYYGHLFAAGFVVLVAGLCDMLDGALARRTDRVTRFGGVLDATLDRLSEAALLLAIIAIYAGEGEVAESVLAGVVLTGSLLVSYLRARLEAIGIEGRVGLFTRAERVIVLALGLLLSRFDYALIIALAIIAVLSFFTAGQRLLYAWQKTRG
jgi:CDP-diacylglycerol--glycerol-3-phosphate 3-phosphatidyltransferase